MHFTTLLALFVVVPMAELWLLFRIAEFLGPGGGWLTLALVILTGAIGASLAKGQGLKVFRAIQQDLMQGQLPTDHVISGLLVLIGGLLLVTPGVVTDLLGLFLMIPGNRRLLIPLLKRRLASHVHMQTPPSFFSDTAKQREAEVVQVEDET